MGGYDLALGDSTFSGFDFRISLQCSRRRRRLVSFWIPRAVESKLQANATIERS